MDGVAPRRKKLGGTAVGGDDRSPPINPNRPGGNRFERGLNNISYSIPDFGWFVKLNSIFFSRIYEYTFETNFLQRKIKKT